MKSSSAPVSGVRQRQRAQAKKRFQQRFELALNRDQIHEIEEKICQQQAVPLPG
jgi:hypothetical protein